MSERETQSGRLELRDLVKIYDPSSGLRAVDGVSLDIEPGEFVTLLGPSGCGKTTILRMLAGFEDVTEGEILLDGKDLLRIAPNKRPISMVFQSYALFPHMSVSDNVGYGLKAAKIRGESYSSAVTDALDHMGLEGLGERSPRQLSGGQQQRVALARAMVTNPRVMLFDEPLSNLDAALRERMRLRIRRLQRELGATSVYVTHDQTEAMALSDRVVVMNSGRIEQVADPSTIYRRPASTFVATFVGRANLIDVDVESVADGRARLGLFGADVEVPAHPDAGTGRGTLLVRPESLKLEPLRDQDDPTGPSDAADRGIVSATVFMGDRVDYEVEWQDLRLIVLDTDPEEHAIIAEGSPVRLHANLPRTWLLPDTPA
ncbi:MAG: ABC transporter ATP-binding protein [Actinomycetia bacterium]|nr:ABC transporter ATP-binding protein [Actinomycetes bacterium]